MACGGLPGRRPFPKSRSYFPLSLNHLSPKTCPTRPLHAPHSAHLRLSHVSAPPLTPSRRRAWLVPCTPIVKTTAAKKTIHRADGIASPVIPVPVEASTGHSFRKKRCF